MEIVHKVHKRKNAKGKNKKRKQKGATGVIKNMVHIQFAGCYCFP